MQNLNTKAIEIINFNKYLTLATTDGSLPWAAPLYYCVDDNFNFYFISQPDSLHSLHIQKQPVVSFAIFDSRQNEGEGNGVQGLGRIAMLRGNEIAEGLKYYSTNFIKLSPEALAAPAPYRLFKLTVEKFFILNPEAKTDQRVEVFLNK